MSVWFESVISEKMKGERAVFGEEVDCDGRETLVAEFFAACKEYRCGDDNTHLAKLAYQLLLTDPMTIQEAGVVARAARDLGREVWPPLADEEWREIYGGGYEAARKVFAVGEVRQKVWAKSEEARNDGGEEVYLFREMKIGDEEAKKIRREGLQPGGIHLLGSVAKVLEKTLGGYTHPADFPIAKFNLLQEVWRMDLDFGGSNPFKLGLSFTTLENLGNPTRIVFGSWMIVARVPANWAVAEKDKHFDKDEDERTVLYDLPPECVAAVVNMEGRDKKQTLAAAEKAVKVDLLKRRFHRVSRI